MYRLFEGWGEKEKMAEEGTLANILAAKRRLWHTFWLLEGTLAHILGPLYGHFSTIFVSYEGTLAHMLIPTGHPYEDTLVHVLAPRGHPSTWFGSQEGTLAHVLAPRGHFILALMRTLEGTLALKQISQKLGKNVARMEVSVKVLLGTNCISQYSSCSDKSSVSLTYMQTNKQLL